ncbi:MAG: hypothetical protein QGI68_01180 [Pseudomonadales bacterium]|nr:hypothetical protein [Pseudomonadales bacterium]MDP7594169.1 hypothetical protein [Pseudomonadales bacterium]
MKSGKPAFVLILTLLAGCYAPLLELTERDPGAVLQPVSRSNIIDARAKFRHIFCTVNQHHGKELPDYRRCDDALHRLADEGARPENAVDLVFQNKLQVYVIPGIFGECLIDQVSPFSFAIDHMMTHDVQIDVVPGILGRATSSHNAEIIHDFFFDTVKKTEDEKLLVIAYSKGTTDMLWYLGNDQYASSHSKVDALISVAGVVNGTPLADGANSLMKKLAEKFPLGTCPKQDGSAIDDLTRRQQLLRSSSQKIPVHIKYYSVVAYTDRANVSRILKPFHRRLSLVDPRNDSQVIYYDSVIPTAHLLGYANADHWVVALPFERGKPLSGLLHRSIALGADKNAYPREVLVEAILRYVDMDL